MKNLTKTLLVGVTIITVAVTVSKNNQISNLETELKLKLKENKNLSNKLDHTATSLTSVTQKNKRLSKRVISEINKIISLKDSVSDLDEDLKEGNRILAYRKSKTRKLLKEKKQLEKEILQAKQLNEEAKIKNNQPEIITSKAKRLDISGMETTLMRKKFNGSFVKTLNSRKIDAFKTNFKIHNNKTTEVGMKKVNIKVYNRRNRTLTFDDVQEIDFDKENLNITSIIEVERGKIEKGLYNIIAYIDGKEVNSSSTYIE